MYLLNGTTRFSAVGVVALIIAALSITAWAQVPRAAVPSVKPSIIRRIPHATNAFTQGLLEHQGKLYESTGLQGRSSLRVIDLKTGAVETNIPVSRFFAEGLAVFDSILVQLTWQNHVALVYTLPSLRMKETFYFMGEGWGLTSDQSRFIMSNGSDTLYWRDRSFKVVGNLAVTMNGKPLARLNELEWCRGRIFANVWQEEFLVEIEPSSGNVVRTIDCGDLVREVASTPGIDVLNGIAHLRKSDTFIVTGKNWPLMFEIAVQ